MSESLVTWVSKQAALWDIILCVCLLEKNSLLYPQRNGKGKSFLPILLIFGLSLGHDIHNIAGNAILGWPAFFQLQWLLHTKDLSRTACKTDQVWLSDYTRKYFETIYKTGNLSRSLFNVKIKFWGASGCLD